MKELKRRSLLKFKIELKKKKKEGTRCNNK